MSEDTYMTGNGLRDYYVSNGRIVKREEVTHWLGLATEARRLANEYEAQGKTTFALFYRKLSNDRAMTALKLIDGEGDLYSPKHGGK